MGMMGVIDFKIRLQTGGKILRGTEIAAFEKSTGQDAKPQFDLIEPWTVANDHEGGTLPGRAALGV
jgi:hypothetical protein